MNIVDLVRLTCGDIPIANPEDAPNEVWGCSSNAPFLFSFGAYGDLHVIVWARSDHWDTAEERAMDWCGEHAPGVFATAEPGDIDEDTGEWPDVVQVSHNAYPWQTGPIGIPSWELHACELHDPLVIHALQTRSWWLTDEIWPED